MDEHQSHVKVLFRLVRDHDGYPPADWESLWAIPRTDGFYELDNVPFFALDVACGDVVSAKPDSDGKLIYEAVVIPSGHSTVRVVLYDMDQKIPTMDALTHLGCEWEGSHLSKLCAVDVPAQTDYEKVLEALDDRMSVGILDYQEAAVRHQ